MQTKLFIDDAWIAAVQAPRTEAPLGSNQQSCIGRVQGHGSLGKFLETQQIMRIVRVEPWGWYLK